jgi:hypothetical protein
MQKIQTAVFVALTFLLPNIAQAEMNERIKEIFSGDVIVLLAEELDPAAHSLRLQDYVADGRSFIPVFTTKEKAHEAFGGKKPDKPMIAINGGFFAYMMKGTETIKINPSLDGELVIPAEEIVNVMKDEVEALRTQFSQTEK